MKNKWLLYLVLFLLAVNAALLSVYLIDTCGDNDDAQSERRDGRRKDKSKHNFEYHLAQELGFSEQQIEEVKAYRNDFRRERKAIKSDMKELRKEYFHLLAKESIDTMHLNDLAEQIGQLEVGKIKMEYKHYRNIRSVCTPEQAILMDSLGRAHLDIQFKHKDSGHERRRDCSESENSNNKTNNDDKE